MAEIPISEQHFRRCVQGIFNNWTGLKLAVEHGMGGRNGHKTAIDIMNYMHDFCAGNNDISQTDVQDVLEQIMDQEFNTLLEDGSVTEISSLLLKYRAMCNEGKFTELETELQRLPSQNEWLTPTAKISFAALDDDDDSSFSESDSDSEESMDVDMSNVNAEAAASNEAPIDESDPGWTTVKSRRRK